MLTYKKKVTLQAKKVEFIQDIYYITTFYSVVNHNDLYKSITIKLAHPNQFFFLIVCFGVPTSIAALIKFS